MNRDFVEMLSELSAAGVEFLVVGAHALAAHGVPRATGDIDIWVRGTPENADRVLAALTRFGAPLFDLRREDLTRAGTVFQIGQPPSRIDILSSISGVAFEAAWPCRILVEIEGIGVQRDVQSVATHLNVVLNFSQELKRRAPTANRP